MEPAEKENLAALLALEPISGTPGTCMNRHFILIDACVAAAHYAPKTTRSKTLRSRAANLFSGASASQEVRLLMPNFCIAEVFSVFEKYRWGRTWNPHVGDAQALTPAQFSASRDKFRAAIHNGRIILQVALDRYHILAVDLISPINNAYKIKRNRGKTIYVTPAKTYDMLIVAMGIWLQQQYGAGRLTVVTGDSRLKDVVERARSVKLSSAMRAHLQQTASALGLTYSPELYPIVVDLTGATKSALRRRFPDWVPEW